MFKIIVVILILCASYSIKKKKLTAKGLALYFLGFVLCIIPAKITNIEQIYIVFRIPQVWMGIIVLACFVILRLAIKFRNKYYEMDANDDINILKRTIDFEYNPSISGFLFNHKLELKDLSADILNLYAKKIVEIKKNQNGKNEIQLGKKYESYKSELKPSDKYILEYIENNNSKFNFSEWRNQIKKEYDKLGFSENKEYISDKMFFIMIISIIVISILIFKVICNWEFITAFFISIGISLVITFIVYILYINISTRYIRFTEKGKNAIKDCIKLKVFMEEYTLLKDRSVEEICIYENYIPYAIALGVNKKYEGTIFEILGEELTNIIEDIEIIEFYDEEYTEKF